ncbi:MAG: HAMP domain-containing sensor histidine kinase, partial [bacterium]|nr:HAMP domain-containing sensor histidine kinase [bacterium]
EISEIYYPYFTDWGSHPFTVKYVVSYAQIEQLIQQDILRGILLVLIFFFIAILLITGVVNKIILAPIAIANKITQRISEGRYGERINLHTNDEIEQLAEATNKMAGTLEQDIIELRELDKLKDEFVDIAAHNLKIPLNHLKFNIAYLLKNLKNKVSERHFELLRDTEINYNKLALLSDDLINVTAIRKGTLQSNVFVPLDLTAIIGEIIEETKPATAAKNLTLKFNSPKHFMVLGDYLKLKQVFINIIDNAIKFSNKEGRIDIHIENRDNGYIVTIIDHGLGIEKEELPHIFQKFYRAHSTERYNKESVGLGLYLAKLIVDVHHGKIWVESEAGKGSKFFVFLLEKEAFEQKHPFK